MTDDRYGDVLVAQPTTAGMDRLRPQVYAAVLKAHAEDPSGPAIRDLYVLVAQPTTAGMDRLRPQVYAAVLKAHAEDPSGPAIRDLYAPPDRTLIEK